MHTARVQLHLPPTTQDLVSKCLSVEADDGPSGTTLVTSMGETLDLDLTGPDLAKLRAHLNGVLRQVDVILRVQESC